MKPFKMLVFTGALSAAALAGCANQLPDPAAPRSLAPSAVTTDQLRKFATAAKQVNSIYREYEPRVQSAPPGGADLMSREANGREAKAVLDAGLTVPEFNAINAAILQDPGLMQRYAAVY